MHKKQQYVELEYVLSPIMSCLHMCQYKLPIIFGTLAKLLPEVLLGVWLVHTVFFTYNSSGRKVQGDISFKGW